MLYGTVYVHPPTVSPPTGTKVNTPVAPLKLLKTEVAGDTGVEGAPGPEIITPMLLGSSVATRVAGETTGFGKSFAMTEVADVTTSCVPMTAA